MFNSTLSAKGARMNADDDEGGLPEVQKAPLVIDVEFTEVEEETAAPMLDAVDEISTARARPPLDLPAAQPTPEGRARVVTVINQKGGVGKTCLLYTSPSPRD